MTFRGRAEKLGWANGSVTDRGGVNFYRKVFPGAGVEAFLGLEGMWVALRGDESIELQGFYFVKSGLVRVGSYVRDNPSDESDDRLIAFGAVPPLVYSEVMGDLKRIAGQSGEEGAGFARSERACEQSTVGWVVVGNLAYEHGPGRG